MAQSKEIKYIYELPHTERRQLCRVLDLDNKWEELGGTYMKFDVLTILELRNLMYVRKSPTEELITKWSHQNHTILELFVLLSKMKHYQAMTIIKHYVDEKYHRLIQNGDDNFHCLLQDLRKALPEENGCKLLNVAQKLKIVIPEIAISDEDNEKVPTTNKNLGKPPKSPQLLGPSRTYPGSDISTVASSAGAIPQISYEELKTSTNNWDKNSILGMGGFGTVFKGIWKCTPVAIKRIEQKENTPQGQIEQMRQSITEMHCLNAYRHDNILALYGFSMGGPQPCLVYQYMAGGSLEHRLGVKEDFRVLKWPTRLSIAIGAARGLQFLHTIKEKPLIHGDIKSANILLDSNDIPKIGDFGLAKEGPQSEYTHMTLTRIHGTRPYLPDEFLRAKKFSTKVDTYSFGIVLFELATALRAFSNSRKQKYLKDLVVNHEGAVLELKDQRADGGESCFTGFIEIGTHCVNKRPKDRPEMVAVLTKLGNVQI